MRAPKKQTTAPISEMTIQVRAVITNPSLAYISRFTGFSLVSRKPTTIADKIVAKNREFLRNAAVTGDGCMHFYFDPSVENGQMVKGEIKAEVLDNLRVMFGNPN